MHPDFETMTIKELREYAKLNNIDLGDTKKKADIILLLDNPKNTTIEEELSMEQNNEALQNEVLENEMQTGVVEGTDVVNEDGVNVEGTETNVEGTNVEGSEAGTEGTEGSEANTVVDETKKVWKDAAGNEISMSQFIREQFTINNLSRKDISDTFDINYRTVYGATVNMENAAEPSTRGRGVVNPKILVTADNQVYTTKITGEGEAQVIQHFLNNVEIVAGEDGVVAIPETVETDRNTWIKDQVAANVNRGDVAKALDLSYGVVYGLTKEEDGTRTKHEVEIDNGDGTTTKMPRSEYIRKRVAEGVSKSDVAKELGVEYSVIWQATKKDKADAERFVEAVASMEKFADKISDKEAFVAIIESLKLMTIVEPVEEKVEETPVDGTPGEEVKSEEAGNTEDAQ
jgi:hypothetical protein